MLWGLIAGCVLASGCTQLLGVEDFHEAPMRDAALEDDADVSPDIFARVGVFTAEPSNALDVLFVIDNGGRMAEEQELLTAAFPRLLSELVADSTLMSLHVAVVSSDLGAGPFNISNCAGNGDNGAMQTQARIGGCTPPVGAFIVDSPDGTGGRVTNYSGSLATVFACIATLGASGCGFGQHLESMRRALDGSNATNDAFLRPEAHLLVVILADEDDCSTQDTAMFDTSQNDPGDPLGPLSTFRCYEFGVACEAGNDDPRAEGPRQSCHAQESSAYMHGVLEYADFLRSLKNGPQIMVSAIVGESSSVEVGRDPDRPLNPALVPACENPSTRASPGVRFGDLVAQFPSRAQVRSICADDLTSTLRDTGLRATEAITTSCLSGQLEGSAATLEGACTVSDVLRLDKPSEERIVIPRCTDTGDTPPCFRFEVDPLCRFNDAQVAVVVNRAASPATGTVTVVECTEP